MLRMRETTDHPRSVWISQKTAQRERDELLEKLERGLLFHHYDALRLSLERLAPEFTQAVRERYIELLLLNNRPEQALEACASFLHDDPRNAKIHLVKGEALLALGRYQEALAAYEEAIYLAPDLSEAYKGRGRVYEHLAQQTFEDLKRQVQECYEKAKELGVS